MKISMTMMMIIAATMGLVSIPGTAEAQAPPYPLPGVMYEIVSQDYDREFVPGKKKNEEQPNGNFFLSTDGGTGVDLYNKNDGSNRQYWTFKKVPNSNLYHIMQQRTRTYLSRWGWKVDLHEKDDGSGRQRWKLVPLKDGNFHIMGGAEYLSTDGEGIDNYKEDDRSGRQRWKLLPEDLEFVEIKYDATQQGISKKPDFIVTVVMENDLDNEQQLTAKFGKKAMVTSKFEHEHGFTVAVASSIKVSGPVFPGVKGEASSTLTSSTTNKWTFGKAESSEDSRSYDFPVKCLPKSKVRATIAVKQFAAKVPYTAKAKSKLTGEFVAVKGVWSGVMLGEIKAEYKRIE